MKSLVNKIIFNLSVTCNNLILKYVEEDIVLSMNIKTLSLSTVNKNWEPEFSGEPWCVYFEDNDVPTKWIAIDMFRWTSLFTRSCLSLILVCVAELSLVQLILRNLVNLSDVTICLDKRNASGRIESYLVRYRHFASKLWAMFFC